MCLLHPLCFSSEFSAFLLDVLPVAQQMDYAVCSFWSFTVQNPSCRILLLLDITCVSTLSVNKPDDSVWHRKREESLKLALCWYWLTMPSEILRNSWIESVFTGSVIQVIDYWLNQLAPRDWKRSWFLNHGYTLKLFSFLAPFWG